MTIDTQETSDYCDNVHVSPDPPTLTRQAALCCVVEDSNG